MKELAEILQKTREDRGAIDFDTNEAKVLVDEKGKPIDVVLRQRGESDRIIESFMLVANETVAKQYERYQGQKVRSSTQACLQENF